MIASSPALVPASISPAIQASAVRAAKAASQSPHALINLIRLVKGIEARAPEGNRPGDSPVLDLRKIEDEITKDRENLIYARALLTELNERNEQSSSTSSTLSQLSTTLDSLQAAFNAYSPSFNGIAPSVPLSRVQSRMSTASKRQAPKDASTQLPEISGTAASATAVQPASAARKRTPRTGPSLPAYLSKREKEDAQGGEAGLVAVAPIQPNGAGGSEVDAEKQRKELLAGDTSRAAMSGAQLHEELGGQLAQMSHRLKLNAIHFANSLEEEKAILESSQNALEGNLAATQSSKTQLSAVTRKGRGTTCMSIGIVLLVLVIFVWTYMLIRFT